MHSRRIDPITRSMWARCQGERGAESTSSMPGSRTSLVKPAPKMPSRPRRRCRGTCSNGKASRSCCPVHSAVGLRGDVEMHDPPAVVSQHQEHVQHLKANGRHREEVDRNRGLHVVFQEGPPCLRRRIPTADHVFAHAGLADVNAEFEEFPVDTRSAPERVLAAHLPNQLTDFLRHRRAAALAAANLPSPKQSKSLAVPSYDGSRFDDAKSRAPFGPGSTKPSPQEPVEPAQFWLLDRALHHAKLMAESQDLKLQRRSSAEDRHYGREQCR